MQVGKFIGFCQIFNLVKKWFQSAMILFSMTLFRQFSLELNGFLIGILIGLEIIKPII